MVEAGDQFGLDLLEAGSLGPDFGEGAVRAPERDGESPGQDEDARVWIAGDETCDVLHVAGAELEALGFAARVPDQVGQEAARIVVTQGGGVGQPAFEDGLTVSEFGAVGSEEMAMDPHPGIAGEPGAEVLEQPVKALERP